MMERKQRRLPINIRWLMVSLFLVNLFIQPDLPAWQKNIRFENIGVEQGLPDKAFQTMVQDKYGFLWFATGDGLVKYDGYRFTVFKNNPENPDLLLSNYVPIVYIDRQDVIWLGTPLGLSRFNREQESFTHYTHDPDNPTSLGAASVFQIFEDHEGMLWVSHWRPDIRTTALSRFDRISGTFEHYHHDTEKTDTLPAGTVFNIYEDLSGVLWVGTFAWAGVPDLARFDRDSNTFTRVFACDSGQSQCAQPATEADRVPSFGVGGILEDKEGNFWISGNGNGLIKYDHRSNTYSHQTCDHVHPGGLKDKMNQLVDGNIVEDGQGRLWFDDRYRGLTSFDPETGKFNHYLHDSSNPHSIVADSHAPFFLYPDRSGFIWVLGLNNTISKFDPDNPAFGAYRHDQKDPNSLSSNFIFAVAEDHAGLLWIGHDGLGLDRIDRVAGTVTVFRNDPNNPGSLPSNDISDLYVDQNGVLWIGTLTGLSRFNEINGTFTQLSLGSMANSRVWIIGEDSHGFLWLGGYSEVIRFDPGSGEFTQFQSIPDQPGTLEGERFSIGLITEVDTVWIASILGINRFDQDTGTFTCYSHDPNIPGSIREGYVTSIKQDQNGILWVGTTTGVDRFNSSDEVFIHVNDIAGTSLGRTDALEFDSNGNLWLSNAQSKIVRKFNPVTGEARSYLKDSIALDEGVNLLLLSNGEMIISGRGGINIFSPDELPDYQHDPKVVFTDFRLANKPVPVSRTEQTTPLSKHINVVTEITLTYKNRLFSFEFAAPGYKYPKDLKYAYKLERFDEDWIETGSDNRHATFTNVPSGNYVLRVKARSRDAEWGDESFINVRILPPWWRTWWAYSIYVIAFFLTMFSYIRLRTLGLTRRAQLLEKTVKERTARIREHEQHIEHQAEDLEELLHLKEKLITNISHEFRTPLTLISGPVKRMLQNTENPQNHSYLQLIRRNSQRLLRLVDQLLGLAQLGGEEPLPKSTQAITKTARTITESFRVLAEEKDLKLTMQPGDELYVNCAADALDKILLNLLSNAIKYTPAGGSITMGTTLDESGMVALAVSDTGVGISKEDQEVIFERFHRVGDHGEAVPGAGIGLALVRELVVAYGGRVQLDSVPGKGTTVVVYLPQGHMAPEMSQNRGGSVNAEAISLEVESITQAEVAPIVVADQVDDGKPSILIVEDNKDMQNYLFELLCDIYHCDLADDGQQALERAYEHIPDLVLLDVMLPKMDGFQVSHALKEDERTSHIPIVMLTALGDRESRKEGWQEKVDAYFSKPFDDEELKLRIANLLEIRDILKNRFSNQFFEEERPGQILNEKENGFMEKLERMLDRHHAEAEFGLSQLAAQMYMSTRQLQRKLKAITGHNPTEYLRSYRLRKARKLLQVGTQVGLTSDTVGFSSPAYFSSCFKAQFGQTPSEYQQQFN